MRSTMWHAASKGLVVGLALLWLCGCCTHLEKIFQPILGKSSSGKAETASESNPFVHKVKWPGESLSIIAKWYTGDSKNWKALAKTNPDLNPNLIRIGDNIEIPQGLLKKDEPMPRYFMYESSEKSKLEREQLELLDEVWDVSLDSDS